MSAQVRTPKFRVSLGRLLLNQKEQRLEMRLGFSISECNMFESMFSVVHFGMELAG